MGDTNCDLSSGLPNGNSRYIPNLYQLFSLKQLIEGQLGISHFYWDEFVYRIDNTNKMVND